MRMTRARPRMAFGAAVVLLAGCDRQGDVDLRNQSGQSVTVQIRRLASQSDFVRPGRWEATITVKRIDVTGMPEAALARMKQEVGKPHMRVTCLTPDQVRQGAFYIGEENRACVYDRFAMGHGNIQGTLRCEDAMGRRSMTMAGDYAPDRYALLMTTDVQSSQPQAPGTASVDMVMEARRTGICTGTEDGRQGPSR